MTEFEDTLSNFDVKRINGLNSFAASKEIINNNFEEIRKAIKAIYGITLDDINDIELPTNPNPNIQYALKWTGTKFVLQAASSASAGFIDEINPDDAATPPAGKVAIFVDVSDGSLSLKFSDEEIVKISGQIIDINWDRVITRPNFNTLYNQNIFNSLSARLGRVPTQTECLEEVFFPYLMPTFNPLSGSIFTTREVGENLPAATYPVNYSVNNSTQIKSQPPNIGTGSTTIPGGSVPTFQLLAAGTFDVVVGSNYNLTSRGGRSITVQGIASNDQAFDVTSNAVFWDFRRICFLHDMNEPLFYYDSSTLSSIINANHRVAADGGISDLNYSGNFGTLNLSCDTDGQKVYFLINAALDPSDQFILKDGNGFTLTRSKKQFTYTNPFGVAVLYNLYTIGGSPLDVNDGSYFTPITVQGNVS